MYHILYRSEPRAEHIAWTPPSHPDTIVLFGGHNTGTEQNAEIVPGGTFEIILNHIYIFFPSRWQDFCTSRKGWKVFMCDS